MGGPWRARGYDPGAWRRPTPHVGPAKLSHASETRLEDMTTIVIAYIASVVTSFAVMMAFLKSAW